jgi:hypothetical protein
LEKIQQFGAISKIFGRAVFEAIEVKGLLMLNFAEILRLRPPNFSIFSESLAANLKKVRQTSV